MASKYTKLGNWLKNNNSEEIPLTFIEVEEILSTKLPYSAWNFSSWWANDIDRTQAKAWLLSGYKTGKLSIVDKKVTFIKEEFLDLSNV
jgi:hypothetical protein